VSTPATRRCSAGEMRCLESSGAAATPPTTPTPTLTPTPTPTPTMPMPMPTPMPMPMLMPMPTPTAMPMRLPMIDVLILGTSSCAHGRWLTRRLDSGQTAMSRAARAAMPRPAAGGAMSRASLVLALLLASTAVAEAQPSEARVVHIEKALAELKSSSEAIVLDRAIYEAVRLRCKPVALACMIAVAREHCAQRGCMAAADVIVTNQHAERDVLDDVTRMKLVRTTSDYHAAVLAEVRERVQRVLAAELVLARPGRSVAARIDRTCVERDHVAARRCARGAAACVGSVPYNRCVAALVWFVSTEEAKP
jgi:hypothetical protein